MIAPLCNSKTAFLPVDQVKRPEKAVFVFEKVLMCEKLHLFWIFKFCASDSRSNAKNLRSMDYAKRDSRAGVSPAIERLALAVERPHYFPKV